MDRLKTSSPAPAQGAAGNDDMLPQRGIGMTLLVLLACISAALHVGKLPPAVPALRQALGIGLVEAGVLLAVVQVAGMTLGLILGLMTNALGLRRSVSIGLGLLATASALGAVIPVGPSALALLIVLRVIEGVGFLLAVTPAPALVRAFAPRGTEKLMLGLWSAYMPAGMALALLFGPVCIAWLGWRGWWALPAALSAGVALAVRFYLPALSPHPPPSSRLGGTPLLHTWLGSLRQTLRARAPRALALSFGVYAAQWIVMIGFLPVICVEAGLSTGHIAVLTAVVAAMNIVGNVLGGHFLQHGVAPPLLLRWGFVMMALSAVAAYAQVPHVLWLGAGLRYFAVCLFSLSGGMVPATLFMLGVRLAPAPALVSSTVGLMMQVSALGQFLAPPLAAWLAHRVGGWQWTWAVTSSCALVGIAGAARLRACWRLAQQESVA
ncbi:MAG: MFS transporter [Burkholderiaceae bacterium]|jgi:MFS family permease|nr:MFS transporter [Burkholderiaceae bacterium]